MTKLEREWAVKLKASGFHDLEGPERDGPLSNAGKPHAKYETADGHRRLGNYLADGVAYQNAARDLLWSQRWPNATDRRIWQKHVDGAGLREITASLGVSWHRASKVLHECRKTMTQVREEKARWAKKTSERARMKRLIRDARPALLVKLARLLATNTILTVT